MAFPVFRHLDSAQVRVSGEADPEKVKDLTFKEIGGRPDGSYGFDDRAAAIQPNFQPYPLYVGDREYLVDDLEPRFRGIPVHARQVREEVKQTICLIAQPSA